MKTVLLICLTLLTSNVFSQTVNQSFQEKAKQVSKSEDKFRDAIWEFGSELRSGSENPKKTKRNLKKAASIYGSSLATFIKESLSCIDKSNDTVECADDLQKLRNFSLSQYRFMKGICYIGPTKFFSKYSKLAESEKNECLDQVQRIKDFKIVSNATAAYFELEICDLLADATKYSIEDNLKIRYLICQ